MIDKQHIQDIKNKVKDFDNGIYYDNEGNTIIKDDNGSILIFGNNNFHIELNELMKARAKKDFNLSEPNND